MREELFLRGIIDVATFEHEVREKAIKSQIRERLDDPFSQEPEEVWRERMSKVRDILTEFYFAMNFKYSEFLGVVKEVLSDKRPSDNSLLPFFNAEIAPWKMLFNHARQIEKLPEDQKERVRYQLREIIVVLTKGMLSDQLSFVGIAKNTLSTTDLEWIYKHRVGRGKIGGKSGGMMLAKSILHNPHKDDPVDFRKVVWIPDSYFLGSDIIYEFVEENKLTDAVNEKYKPFETIKEDYPKLAQQFVDSTIPAPYRNQLREILVNQGTSPLIVRSSSLLEDNFGIAFAGKYESYFCPNQGTLEENLEDLCRAIKRVFASIVSPDAIAYRQQKGLIDYDERMAILIQKVQGQAFGDYFFPAIAGVGFSHNPFQWSPRIDRSAGFLRIVAGLGTRAVDRLGGDYAKMVALSHPGLQPVKSVMEKMQYSQKNMDVINLKKNIVETVPLNDVLTWDYPHLRSICSVERERELHQIFMVGPGTIQGQFIVTFDGLLKNVRFIKVMKSILKKLELNYNRPVDIEFTVEMLPGSANDFQIKILQCRQQSKRAVEEEFGIPKDIPSEDIIFASQRMVSTGRVPNIRYIVFVDPENYNQMGGDIEKVKLARMIGRLNERLKDEVFILVGPGRWGSSNYNLGVPVSYADIFNCRALVEIALPYGDAAPEASYGTHFFQDLVESNIFPLPVYPGEKGASVNSEFFKRRTNLLSNLVGSSDQLEEYLSVIDLKAETNGRVLEIIMNAREEKAIAYITKEETLSEHTQPPSHFNIDSISGK